MERPLQTVVETAEFLARSSKLMSDEQRAQVVEMLARDPECGEIMQGTGGVPVFALTVFAKNERANLTPAERNAMAAVVRTIKQQLERRTS